MAEASGHLARGPVLVQRRGQAYSWRSGTGLWGYLKPGARVTAWALPASHSLGDVRIWRPFMSIRPVRRLIQSKPTLEGAGVHLRRAFGFGNTKDFDPFLLLDHFRNDVPESYLPGFPWHHHRGIETITYVLAGTA